MKKTTNTNTRTATTKTPAVTNSKRVLNELNKLQKYKNGVKYNNLSDFTGHLLFRDVITVVNRLAGITPTRKTTTSTTKRASARRTSTRRTR